MKMNINGKGMAKRLAAVSRGGNGEPLWVNVLFKEADGEYYLYKKEGEQEVEIVNITEEKAKKWGETYLESDVCERVFGEPTKEVERER